MAIKETVFIFWLMLSPLMIEAEDKTAISASGVNVQSLKEEIDEIKQMMKNCGCGCPTGWSLHKGSCYHMVSTATKTFSEAREKCMDLGADLLIIKSAEENDFISEFPNTKGRDWAWLGLRRKVPGLKFYWVDGTPLEGKYDSWGPGEPNNTGGNEHCVYTNRMKGNWNDFRCERTSTPGPSVVCQK